MCLVSLYVDVHKCALGIVVSLYARVYQGIALEPPLGVDSVGRSWVVACARVLAGTCGVTRVQLRVCWATYVHICALGIASSAPTWRTRSPTVYSTPPMAL